MKNNHYTSLAASKAIHAALPTFETEFVTNDMVKEYPALTLSDVLLAIEELGKVRGWIEDATAPDFIEECLPENLKGGRMELAGADLRTPLWEEKCLEITSLYLTHHNLSHDTVTEWLVNLFGDK